MTQTRAVRPLATAATLLIALGLGACGDTPTDPPASEETTSEATPEQLDKPEQQEIDAATAKAALPVLEDMPEGPWEVDGSTFSDTPVTYDPAFCGDVELDSPDVRTFEDQHRTAREQARYSAYNGEGNEIIGAWIESYDAPFPLTFFDAAGNHTTDCASYTWARDGEPYERHVKSIPLPPLGDRAFGVRLWSTEGSYTDRLYVRSGHNVITVMVTSKDDTYDGTELTRLAQGILDDLKKDTP